MDDYEEGDHGHLDPKLIQDDNPSSVSYNWQTGNTATTAEERHKIGNVVHIWFDIKWI